MQKYLRGTKIITKNSLINKLFKIEKGTIAEYLNNQKITTYSKGDILPIEYYKKNSIYDYISLELTTGIWINDYNINTINEILSNKIIEQKRQLELLLINDPTIKLARFIYYKYIDKQVLSFYLDMKIKELSEFLKVKKREISETISLFTSKKILTKNNNLFIIHNLEMLIFEAFKNDY